MQFTKQHLVVDDNTTVTAILDAIVKALKPKHFDLQNHGKLFEFKQGKNVPSAKYLQDLRQLYEQTNYLAEVPQETLIHDLFISDIASSEAKQLLFQKDSDTLTIDCCLHLVTSYESVGQLLWSLTHHLRYQSQQSGNIAISQLRDLVLNNVLDAVNSQHNMTARIVQHIIKPVDPAKKSGILPKSVARQLFLLLT